MIKKGSTVIMHYTLHADGEVVESSKGREPLEYVQGEGQIIPGLEEQLEGLAVGDTKRATVTPDKGYGTLDPQMVQQGPREALADLGELKVGDMVTGQAGERPFQARIAEIKPETVSLDLNHPLAGKTLQFDVEILEVE